MSSSSSSSIVVVLVVVVVVLVVEVVVLGLVVEDEGRDLVVRRVERLVVGGEGVREDLERGGDGRIGLAGPAARRLQVCLEGRHEPVEGGTRVTGHERTVSVITPARSRADGGFLEGPLS